MERQARLNGIDLIRGISAFAVAILHAGDETNSINVDYWATELREFCGFVVPFFLITSFYLLISKFASTGKSYPINLRIKRLLIPYTIWSVIYLVVRSVKFLIVNEPEDFKKIGDITSVIFFGAASVQLYFIPLLFTGTFLLIFAEKLVKLQVPLYHSLCVFIISLGGYQYLLSSNNYFKLGPNTAFDGLVSVLMPSANNNQFIRVILVLVAWLIRCAPYVFAALVINYAPIKIASARLNRLIAVISLGIFLFISFLGSDNLPQSIYEIARAVCLLIFAIYISHDLPSSPIIKSVGLCSFGIYLMHYMVIQVLRVPIGKLYPDLINYVSVPTQLMFALLGFGISWLATTLLMKRKQFSKLMFGA
jgi:peptidoglycan/LPS O-acetylase OafA/YrhL